ncbi:MAG: hypothetical protein WCR06_04385 [bacterium]
MRFAYNVLVLILFFASAPAVCAKPFDATGAELLDEVVTALREGKGALPISLSKKLHDAARRDCRDIRLVAAYGLAYSNDDGALETLQKLSTNANDRVAGVASWAITIHSVSGQTITTKLKLLSGALAQATNQYYRIMLAQTLGREFRQDAVPVLRSSLLGEKDAFVRFEFARQLVSYCDNSIMKEVIQTVEKDQVTISTAMAYFLRKVADFPQSSAEVRAMFQRGSGGVQEGHLGAGPKLIIAK